jgi:general secretion pathway protein H
MLVRQNRGFTLIEMMVVIGLVAALLVMSMPYLSNRNSQVKGALREIVVLSRELHTKAKLQGVVYRLVINMQEDSGGGKRAVQTFWVERSKGASVLKPNEEAEAFEHAKDKDKPADPRGFEFDKSFFKKPKSLPEGLIFQKVELSRLTTPITSGKAFIHYLPQGLVDEAAIHIKGEGKSMWTISIHPLTGKAEMISKVIDLKEIKAQ